MPRRYADLDPSRTPTKLFGSSTRPMGIASQNSMLPWAITTFPVSLPLGDVFLHVAMNLRSTLQPLMPSLSISRLGQTPGCRPVSNRSTLSPSYPVLSALHPQGFRTRFALAATRHSFERAPPPTKVFSCATLSQCSYTGLSRGCGCKGHSLVWAPAVYPNDAKQDPVVYGAECGVVFLAKGPRAASI